MFFLSILYTLASIFLALNGFNSLYLILAYYRTNKPRPIPPPPAEWPRVTVQLPIFNELFTIERLLTAVCALEYPQDRLEIQVLDDSNDDTTRVAAGLVSDLRARGVDIVHLHRTEQTGFKAGALNAGMKAAKGDYFAIFDADFIPPKDYLLRTIPWFTSPKIGCVQGRWVHTNRDYSLTTRIQALALDVFGVVLQAARARNGLFFQFTGTAGVISRKCLEDSGGWDSDTLTEDFDFSFKAQLRGWRFEYLPDLEVPAELPVQMAAFKRQQARWSKGNMQTLRKHLLPLLRSSFSTTVKIQGMFLLMLYLIYPMILVILLLAWPAALYSSLYADISPFIMAAAVMAPVLYLITSTPGGPNWWKRFKLIPAMLLLGIGMSASNSKAALEGLFSRRTGVFLRTPKFAIQRQNEAWENSFYSLGYDPMMWAELALVVYALVSAYFVKSHNLGVAVWTVIYSLGFVFISGITMIQAIRRRAKKRVAKKAVEAAK